jgi:hypothetical protein
MARAKRECLGTVELAGSSRGRPRLSRSSALVQNGVDPLSHPIADTVRPHRPCAHRSFPAAPTVRGSGRPSLVCIYVLVDGTPPRWARACASCHFTRYAGLEGTSAAASAYDSAASA